jgi:hypothetical protein
MPLSSPEDYDRLGEHLAEIDETLTTFSRLHGYAAFPRALGRYPNRNITQEGQVMRSIQITMDNALNGGRFDRFFPEIPYTICGVAWIDDHPQHKRWHCPNIRIEGVPFCILVPALKLHLVHFHGYLSSISEQYIRACARSSTLAPLPPDRNP